MPELPPPPAVQWQPVTLEQVQAPTVIWRPVEQGDEPPAPPVRWKVVDPQQAERLIEPQPIGTSQTSLAEVEERLQDMPVSPTDYPALLRLGQLPVATFLEDGYGQLSFQQVSPGSGGVGGGTGNQNYAFRADLSVNTQVLISGFFTYADDPLFARINVRRRQPENIWTVAGGALRAKLAGSSSWALAAEGSVEVFSVGSGGCYGAGCSNTTDNMFNTSGQKVYTRNVVGSLSLPLSWKPTPSWQLSLTPGVSFLPTTQGAGQGGAGTFYGTNVTVGLGSSYRVGDQLNLFSSAVLPLGPGSNAFNSNLSFYRVPILSAGAHYALNPRIALEASITNGYGLSPATAVLALPSAPFEPLLSGRFVWTVGALDSPRVRFTPRQRSLSFSGLSVSTALLPPDGTTQLWANGDNQGNLFVSGAYSVSNDFAFEASGGTYGNAGGNTFLNTYLGQGNRTVRLGGKAMVLRPTKALPLWAAGRITVGRNFQSSSYQGYLFLETVNTWEASPWLAFNLNPKLAWSGLGTPWGVGLSANIQLADSLQLIPEVNAVATSFGGRNGSNGTLTLRWFPTPAAALDVYVSNASGLLDMGQLISSNQMRVGAKLTVQF